MTNDNGYDLLQQLAEPFEDTEIEWKIQTVIRNGQQLRGLALPYVQARSIQNRLDKVCGLGWKSAFKVLPLGNITAVECTLSILHKGDWIERRDAAELTQFEAVKGGYSDSLKRAAVQFGIGRFLYALPQFWVDIVDYRPNGDCEYVSGKYKVAKKEEYISGYYIRPSIKALLHRTNQPVQNHSQNQIQNTGQLQQPSTQLQLAQRNVIDCLEYLKIPLGVLPQLCQQVKIRQSQHIEQLNFEELQMLHSMLNPVKVYIQVGKEHFGQSYEQLFAYASELIGQPVGGVSQLFNTLKSDDVNRIFNKIGASINDQQQRMA